jgi:hypothetical protein
MGHVYLFPMLAASATTQADSSKVRQTYTAIVECIKGTWGLFS